MAEGMAFHMKLQGNNKKRKRFEAFAKAENKTKKAAPNQEVTEEIKTDSELNYSKSEECRIEGNDLAVAGDYAGALRKWGKGIQLAPNRAVFYELIAQIYNEQEKYFAAITNATKATVLDPQWEEAWVTLGRAQLNMGELSLAKQSFETGEACKPGIASDDLEHLSNLIEQQKIQPTSQKVVPRTIMCKDNTKTEIPFNVLREGQIFL